MSIGDEEAFERLHRATASRVLAYCLRHTDRTSAQDAVAETFAIAWRRRSDIPEEALPWLLVTARNVLRNQERSLRRRLALHRTMVPLMELAEPSPDLAVARREELVGAPQALPASEREALLLVVWDGLTAAQAAEVLGSTPGAVRVRIHRARGRIREFTSQGEGDD